MKTFLKAIYRGVFMTHKIWWRWIQIPIFLVGLIVVIGAPFGLSQIESPILKTLAWIFLLIIIMVTAICASLTPYLGQKAITDDYVREQKAITEDYVRVSNNYMRDFSNEKIKREALEQENRKLKEEISKLNPQL